VVCLMRNEDLTRNVSQDAICTACYTHADTAPMSGPLVRFVPEELTWLLNHSWFSFRHFEVHLSRVT
jgi:hypothetical protein